METIEHSTNLECLHATVHWLLMHGANPSCRDHQGKNAENYLETYIKDVKEIDYFKQAFSITMHNILSSLVLDKVVKEMGKKGINITKKPIIFLEIHIDDSCLRLVQESETELVENNYTTLCVEHAQSLKMSNIVTDNTKELKAWKDSETAELDELYESLDNTGKEAQDKRNNVLLDYALSLSLPLYRKMLESGKLSIIGIDPDAESKASHDADLDDSKDNTAGDNTGSKTKPLPKKIDQSVRFIDENLCRLRDIGLFNGFALSVLQNHGGSILMVGGNHVPYLCKLFQKRFPNLNDIQPLIVFPHNKDLPHPMLKAAMQECLPSTKRDLEALTKTHRVQILDMSLSKYTNSVNTFKWLLTPEAQKTFIVPNDMNLDQALMPLADLHPRYVQVFRINSKYVAKDTASGQSADDSHFSCRSFRTKKEFIRNIEEMMKESIPSIFSEDNFYRTFFGETTQSHTVEFSIRKLDTFQPLNFNTALEAAPVYNFSYQTTALPNPEFFVKLLRYQPNQSELGKKLDRASLPRSILPPLIFSSPKDSKKSNANTSKPATSNVKSSLYKAPESRGNN